MIDRNDLCWCGSGKKWKKCHWPDTGDAAFDALRKKYWDDFKIYIKDSHEINEIRKAGHLAALILEEVCAAAVAGVTTKELDRLALELTLKNHAKSATIGYGTPPYPAAICTSLNEVICHGIPDERPLQEGDILNIDYSCVLNGFWGDCSKMVMIGKVTPEKKMVVEVCYEATMAAIAIVKPGATLNQIGDVISDIAEKHHLAVVEDYVGHGVGVGFHENPQVFYHRNKTAIPLVPGMIFTIEPMLNVGVVKGVVDKKDGWTVRTADGKPSAQWEHQILVTETGVEILTPWNK